MSGLSIIGDTLVLSGTSSAMLAMASSKILFPRLCDKLCRAGEDRPVDDGVRELSVELERKLKRVADLNQVLENLSSTLVFSKIDELFNCFLIALAPIFVAKSLNICWATVSS